MKNVHFTWTAKWLTFGEHSFCWKLSMNSSSLTGSDHPRIDCFIFLMVKKKRRRVPSLCNCVRVRHLGKTHWWFPEATIWLSALSIQDVDQSCLILKNTDCAYLSEQSWFAYSFSRHMQIIIASNSSELGLKQFKFSGNWAGTHVYILARCLKRNENWMLTKMNGCQFSTKRLKPTLSEQKSS